MLSTARFMTLLLHRCGVSWFKGMYSSWGTRELAADEGTNLVITFG